jgi:hypothetical protein
VLIAAFALTLTPWAVRNARALGAFVPVATQGGMTLWAGNHPPGGTGFGILPHDATTRAAATLPEPEASAYLVHAQIQDWARRPGALPGLAVRKTLLMWAPFDWEILPRGGGTFNPTYAFTALWLLIGIAYALGKRHGRGVAATWPVWLPVLYFQLIALVFYGSPRFRMPLEPLLALGAAWALVETARRRGRRFTVGAAVTSGVLLLAATAAAAPLRELGGRFLGL